MCPKCYVFSNLANKHLTQLQLSYDTNLIPSNDFCQVIDPIYSRSATVYFYFMRLFMRSWMLILLYSEEFPFVFRLAQCNKRLYRYLNEDFWRKLCIEWGTMDEYMKVEDLDEIPMILPSIECPSTYKRLFTVLSMKHQWIKNKNRNVQEISKFLPIYEKLKNSKFGSARIFSNCDIYLIYNEEECLISFEDIELFQKFPMCLRVQKILNSGNILDILKLQDRNICFMIISCFKDFISFSDIGETINLMKSHTNNLFQNTITEMLIDIYPPEREIPYECYNITQKHSSND